MHFPIWTMHSRLMPLFPTIMHAIKAKVASLGHQLEVSEQQQQLLSERLKTVEDEKMELQSRFRSKELELTSQLEELRAEVGK